MRRLLRKVKDDHDYKPYLDAVNRASSRRARSTWPLTRLFTARMKLGMFDPPEIVPYSKIDEKLLDCAAHRAMARALANEEQYDESGVGHNVLLDLEEPKPGESGLRLLQNVGRTGAGRLRTPKAGFT